MNPKIQFILAAMVSGIVFQPAFLRAQGALTPPGAPAPTMKTLTQIEPRTPISSAPFFIFSSGSFYLTTNLTVSAGSAITISANNVRLDLNGFTLSSTETPATTGCGILLNSAGVTNITVANGFISSGVTNNGSTFSGSGFGYGIYGASAINTRITGVSVSGCRLDGINLGNNSSLVESCTVNMVGGNGIMAQSVASSSAQNCEQIAIFAQTANNCSGASLASSGIDCSIANNCNGSTASTGPTLFSMPVGLFADTANNCTGSSSGNTGVEASIANACVGVDSSNGVGILAQIAIGCYGAGDGDGISSTIANACYSSTGDAAIQYKYNMP